MSPVTDFREACCRQYEMGECTRSGFCNFMHLKPISRELRRDLYGRGSGGGGGGGNHGSRSRKSRSRSRERRHASSRKEHGGGGGGGGRRSSQRAERDAQDDIKN
ncbi:Splicing factor U2af 38 kDa subunit, partial [Caligus rogercresseyi]